MVQGEVSRWKKGSQETNVELELMKKQAVDKDNVRRAFSYLSHGTLPDDGHDDDYSTCG
jgi:hypothetical protein